MLHEVKSYGLWDCLLVECFFSIHIMANNASMPAAETRLAVRDTAECTVAPFHPAHSKRRMFNEIEVMQIFVYS